MAALDGIGLNEAVVATRKFGLYASRVEGAGSFDSAVFPIRGSELSGEMVNTCRYNIIIVKQDVSTSSHTHLSPPTLITSQD